MNLKLTTPERKEFIKELVDDELKSLVREEFKKKYEETIEREIKIKIDRLVEQNSHLFVDIYKSRITRFVDSYINQSFGKVSNDGGVYCAYDRKTIFNDKTRKEVCKQIFDHLKKEFDIKGLKESLKEEIVKKLVGE